MPDPYRMVFVNIASSLVLISFVLIYRFIFPKRNINLFFLLILISILPVISIFRTGAYESGDFNIHIYRVMEFYKVLSEGIIMPSWAGELNATYGYPLFIFNYPFPYYLISFLHFVGFSFITSVKIFLAFSYILSGVFMYFFAKDLFKNNFAAFTASIFYLFTPYYLIDLHFKVAIGELLTFTIIPLFFISLHRLRTRGRARYLVYGSFSLSLLFMSNALVAFFVAALALAYTLFFTVKRSFDAKYLLRSFFLFFLGLVLSIYIWIPPFIFNSALYIENAPLIIGYSPTIPDLLYAPWRMGFLFQGHYGEISNLIGYTQIFIIIAIFFALISKRIARNQKREIFFWMLTIIFIIFLITSPSRFIWERLSFVKAAGSHRLLLILTFCVSVMAGYLSLMCRKKHFFVWGIIFVTIGYTMLNWGHRKVIPEISDATLKRQLWKSTFEGEGHYYANTKWVDIENPWFSKLPKDHLEVIAGTGRIKNILRTSTLHKYSITAKTTLEIQENTLYFPGWKGFVDGKEVLLSPSSRGIIQTSLPRGIYLFEVKYDDIFIYKLLKIISFSTLLFTLILIALIAVKSRPAKHSCI